MFTDIHTNQSGQILDISFKTNAVLINVFAINSSTKFVESLSLLVQMTNIRVTNIPVSNHLIGFINCYEVIMQDLYIDTVQSSHDYLMLLSKTITNSISNVTIRHINTNVLYIARSTVNNIHLLNIYNVSQGIQIKSSNISLIQNCQFVQTGSGTIEHGGALYLEDTSMHLMNVSFENNTAKLVGLYISIVTLMTHVPTLLKNRSL